MKKLKTENSPELVQDVQTLLKDSVLAEATAKVEAHFSAAWKKLDTGSALLLSDYFNGISVEELSRQRNIPEADLEAWLKRTKRELVLHLRSTFQTRQ